MRSAAAVRTNKTKNETVLKARIVNRQQNREHLTWLSPNDHSLVIVWFHQTGHQSDRFPSRPWYRKKQEPSFADMLTTLRRVCYQEQTEETAIETVPIENPIAQFTEFLSQAG